MNFIEVDYTQQTQVLRTKFESNLDESKNEWLNHYSPVLLSKFRLLM